MWSVIGNYINYDTIGKQYQYIKKMGEEKAKLSGLGNYVNYDTISEQYQYFKRMGEEKSPVSAPVAIGMATTLATYSLLPMSVFGATVHGLNVYSAIKLSEEHPALGATALAANALSLVNTGVNQVPGKTKLLYQEGKAIHRLKPWLIAKL